MLILRKLPVAALVIGGVVGSVGTASAQVVTFSDYGTGGPGYQVYGPNAVNNQSQSVAMQFTAQVSGTFTSLDLQAGLIHPGAITVSLTADNGGKPGTLIEYWAVLNGNFSLPDFAGSKGPNLDITAGSLYWVEMSPGFLISDAYWDGSSLTGLVGVTHYNYSQNGTTGGPVYGPSNLAIFDVYVKPPAGTPEPLTVGLSLTGLAVAMRRRMKLQLSRPSSL